MSASIQKWNQPEIEGKLQLRVKGTPRPLQTATTALPQQPESRGTDRELASPGRLDDDTRQRQDWSQIPTVISDVAGLTVWATTDRAILRRRERRVRQLIEGTAEEAPP